MKNYEPTAHDLFIAGYMDEIVEALLEGRMDGIAIVAVPKNGEASYWYINKASTPVLGVHMQSLSELYRLNCESGINAPNNNMSRRRH